MAGRHRNSAAIVRGDRMSSQALLIVCTDGRVQNTTHAVYKPQRTAMVNQDFRKDGLTRDGLLMDDVPKDELPKDGLSKDCPARDWLRTGVKAATVTKLSNAM